MNPHSTMALERTPAVRPRQSIADQVFDAMRPGVAYSAHDLCTRAKLTRDRTTHGLCVLAKRGRVEVVEKRCAADGGNLYRRVA